MKHECATFNMQILCFVFSDAEITVVSANGESQEVTILGIDRFGFLKVQGKSGNAFTVHPDGNSFDILKGLIAPVGNA